MIPLQSATYRVHTLRAATFIFGDATEPGFVWLVEGNGIAMLVDTGTPDASVLQSRSNTDSRGAGPELLLSELQRYGFDAAAINAVAITHLHMDHSWNLDLFPNARLIIQHAELLHAADPVPTQRFGYPREIVASVVARRRPTELQIIDGEVELAAGITAILIPGHTPGMMGLVVQTEKGQVGLCSDAGETYANWYPANPAVNPRPDCSLSDTFLPPHIRTESVLTCIASLRRFKLACDIIVPSHDWRIPGGSQGLCRMSGGRYRRPRRRTRAVGRHDPPLRLSKRGCRDAGPHRSGSDIEVRLGG